MPWIDGEHVSVAEWRALNPLGPNYRYGPDGERWQSRETQTDEEDEGEPSYASKSVEWAARENARRSGLLITEQRISDHISGMGQQIGMVTPADYPGDPTPAQQSSERPRRRGIRNDEALQSVVADVMGLRRDDPRVLEVLATPVEHEPAENAPARRRTPEEAASDLVDPREAASGRFSRALGIRTHRKDRPSQTPKGRRARFIRQVAERDGISIKAAEQLHPPRKPKDPS